MAEAALATSHQFASSWALIWHDEFNGGVNAAPDSSKWAFDIGTGGDNLGWGNQELEEYSASLANVFQDGKGHLVIRAIRSADETYTSGRIKTKGKFEFTYGKVEARIRIPYAQGVWPAFWMLGSNFPETPWPASGEIDIMENFGVANGDTSRSHGTIHGPGYAGAGITAEYRLPKGRLSDAFHVHAIEWSPNGVKFFVDGHLYSEVTPQDIPAGSAWVFDHPFFILLNVAVGGSPAPVGYPDATTTFPQDMLIDYIRVYQVRRARMQGSG